MCNKTLTAAVLVGAVIGSAVTNMLYKSNRRPHKVLFTEGELEHADQCIMADYYALRSQYEHESDETEKNYILDQMKDHQIACYALKKLINAVRR